MADALVEFDSVVKRFGDFTAVETMNFTINEGEFIAIMGPSGCGKTTTLRMLAGLEAPSGGKIRMQGRVMNHVPPHERDTPMVWQSLALFPFLNARENVEFGLEMRGVDAVTRKKKALEWLDRLEIGEFAERDINSLSGGQKQRVALGRAMARQPAVFLMDEPLSNLDAKLRGSTRKQIVELQRQLGTTTLYVTHDQVEAMTMGHRIAVLNQVRLQQLHQTPPERQGLHRTHLRCHWCPSGRFYSLQERPRLPWLCAKRQCLGCQRRTKKDMLETWVLLPSRRRATDEAQRGQRPRIPVLLH